jgi:hypothetical protein
VRPRAAASVNFAEHKTFLWRFKITVGALVGKNFLKLLFCGQNLNDKEMQELTDYVWAMIEKSWYATASNDARERCEKAANAAVEPLMRYLYDSGAEGDNDQPASWNCTTSGLAIS